MFCWVFSQLSFLLRDSWHFKHLEKNPSLKEKKLRHRDVCSKGSFLSFFFVQRPIVLKRHAMMTMIKAKDYVRVWCKEDEQPILAHTLS